MEDEMVPICIYSFTKIVALGSFSFFDGNA